MKAPDSTSTTVQVFGNALIPHEGTSQHSEELEQQFKDFLTTPGMRERMLHFAFRWCRGDVHTAEDVLHSALQNAYQKLSSYEGRSSLRQWVFTIIKNTAVNELRRKIRQQKTEDQLLQQRSRTFSRSHEVDIQVHELCNRISDYVLEDFSEAHRVVFILHFVEELKLTQIAALLNIPRGTVASRLYTIRVRLRAIFADQL